MPTFSVRARFERTLNEAQTSKRWPRDLIISYDLLNPSSLGGMSYDSRDMAEFRVRRGASDRFRKVSSMLYRIGCMDPEVLFFRKFPEIPVKVSFASWEKRYSRVSWLEKSSRATLDYISLARYANDI